MCRRYRVCSLTGELGHISLPYKYHVQAFLLRAAQLDQPLVLMGQKPELSRLSGGERVQ